MKKARTSSVATPSRRRRIIQSVIVFVGCVLIVESLVGDKGLFAMLRARDQYRQLEAALVEAQARNAGLREDARRLREDLAAIEEAARGDLGLIKDGEKVFIIRDTIPPTRP